MSSTGISFTYFAGSNSVLKLLYAPILVFKSFWKASIFAGIVDLAKHYLRVPKDLRTALWEEDIINFIY